MCQNSRRVRAKMSVFVLFLRSRWTGKDLSVIQKQLILKNKLDLLYSHLQWRKKCHLLWITYLFTPSAQGHASSREPWLCKTQYSLFSYRFVFILLLVIWNRNTKQNKASMVPNSASCNLIHSRHTWTPLEQGCTQEQQVLQAYQGQTPRGLPKGAFPQPFPGWLESSLPQSWQTEQSIAEKQPHSTMFHYSPFHFNLHTKTWDIWTRENGIYVWGEAAGVLEVKVAKVFLLVYLGKENCSCNLELGKCEPKGQGS